jgi:hypothetical protein
MLEEDMDTGGGVRIWRTMQLFREEMPLIVVGFIVVFIQVAMSAFIPQLTQSYQEAMFVLRNFAIHRLSFFSHLFLQSFYNFSSYHIFCCRFCADGYANALDGEFLRNFNLNPSILSSRSAFSYNGLTFKCVKEDDAVSGVFFDCACSGPSSDPPTSVSVDLTDGSNKNAVYLSYSALLMIPIALLTPRSRNYVRVSTSCSWSFSLLIYQPFI